MIRVGDPVDDDAELLPALAVLDDHEGLVDRQVEHADQVTAGQQGQLAGRRIRQVGTPCGSPAFSPGRLTTTR